MCQRRMTAESRKNGEISPTVAGFRRAEREPDRAKHQQKMRDV